MVRALKNDMRTSVGNDFWHPPPTWKLIEDYLDDATDDIYANTILRARADTHKIIDERTNKSNKSSKGPRSFSLGDLR